MKKNLSFSLATLLLVFIFQTSCKTSKSSASTAYSGKPEQQDKCEQVIRYYAEQLKAGGQAVDAPTQITINPHSKTITVFSKPPDQAEVNFQVVIENADCSLDANLKSGTATYKGYIKQLDGQSSETILTLTASENGITITGSHPDKTETGMVILVTKWEILPE